MSIEMSKEWLKASKIDLDSIHYIIEVEHLTPVVAFHAQQSVEKALKLS
jgi:HEPN domain-containing protein